MAGTRRGRNREFEETDGEKENGHTFEWKENNKRKDTRDKENVKKKD